MKIFVCWHVKVRGRGAQRCAGSHELSSTVDVESIKRAVLLATHARENDGCDPEPGTVIARFDDDITLDVIGKQTDRLVAERAALTLLARAIVAAVDAGG